MSTQAGKRAGTSHSFNSKFVLLRDTDGGGKADVREVLVSGLTTGNQQLRANGLLWGLDNWVHCVVDGHHGDYGVDTKFKRSPARSSSFTRL